MSDWRPWRRVEDIIGSYYPFPWGVAWHSIARRERVLIIWPFNWICGLMREVYWRIFWGFKPALGDTIYNMGFKAGRDYERSVMEIIIRSRVFEEITKLMEQRTFIR